jgi:cob(I)alamin adenosyltransferase
MRIYTKTGDAGETGLIGGDRVPKQSARIEALGDVDELNATIGVGRLYASDSTLAEPLAKIQNWLFELGA